MCLIVSKPDLFFCLKFPSAWGQNSLRVYKIFNTKSTKGNSLKLSSPYYGDITHDVKSGYMLVSDRHITHPSAVNKLTQKELAVGAVNHGIHAFTSYPEAKALMGKLASTSPKGTTLVLVECIGYQDDFIARDLRPNTRDSVEIVFNKLKLHRLLDIQPAGKEIRAPYSYMTKAFNQPTT